MPLGSRNWPYQPVSSNSVTSTRPATAVGRAKGRSTSASRSREDVARQHPGQQQAQRPAYAATCSHRHRSGPSQTLQFPAMAACGLRPVGGTGRLHLLQRHGPRTGRPERGQYPDVSRWRHRRPGSMRTACATRAIIPRLRASGLLPKSATASASLVMPATHAVSASKSTAAPRPCWGCRPRSSLPRLAGRPGEGGRLLPSALRRARWR